MIRPILDLGRQFDIESEENFCEDKPHLVIRKAASGQHQMVMSDE